MGRILLGIDRDDTLVDDPGYLGKDPNWKDQLRFLPSTFEGLVLAQQVARLTIITNQAGVARGYFPPERTDEINCYLDGKLREGGIRIDSWHTCPYVDHAYAKEKNIPITSAWVKEPCDMRKPGIGMLKEAAGKMGTSLDQLIVYVVGDKVTDVQTALNANGVGILFNNGKNKKDYEKAQALAEKHPGRVLFAKSMVDVASYLFGAKS